MFMRFPDKTPRESEADHTFPITANKPSDLEVDFSHFKSNSMTNYRDKEKRVPVNKTVMSW